MLFGVPPMGGLVAPLATIYATPNSLLSKSHHMMDLIHAVRTDLGKRLYLFQEGKLWNHERNEAEQNEFFKQAMSIRAAMRQLSKLICNCRDEKLWEMEGCKNFEDWLGKHELSYEDVDWRPKDKLEEKLLAMLDSQRQNWIGLHDHAHTAFTQFRERFEEDIKELHPYTGDQFFSAANWTEFAEQAKLCPLLDSECMEKMIAQGIKEGLL